MTDYIRTSVTAAFDVGQQRSVAISAGEKPLKTHNANVVATQSQSDVKHGLIIDSKHAAGNPVDVDFSVFTATASVQLSNITIAVWDKLTSLEHVVSARHEYSEFVFSNAASVAVSAQLQRHDVGLIAPQLFVDLYSQRPSEFDLLSRELLTDLSGDINLDEPGYIPSGRIEWGTVRLTDLPSAPMSSIVTARVYQPLQRDQDLVTPWARGASYSYDTETPYLTEPPVVKPGDIPAATNKRGHINMNSVNVYALPGNEPLQYADIKIDLDVDTFSWGIAFDVLNENSADLLKKTVDGPAQFKIEINGYEWVGFVRSRSRSKSVSNDNKLNKRYSIRGFSRSQFLAAPFAPLRTKSIGTTTAIQAATEELAGTGFTLNWNTSLLPDWNMNNAAFSYQSLSPIQVIKRLAATAGGVVIPSMNTDELTIQPRYKYLPWALLTADMDRTIHESQIISQSDQQQPGQQHNSVWVIGEREGVALQVTRSGTAGDNPANDIIEPWLTAQEANQSRGAQEIANTGESESYTLSLQIPESHQTQPGLLLPGLTVAVQHDNSANDYRAYVTGVSITAPGRGSATVRQSVTLRRPAAWEAAA